MGLQRRRFFKILAGSLGSLLLGSQNKLNGTPRIQTALDDSFAMLNDCTLCIGCRACQTACKQSHNLGQAGPDPRYDMPTELNSKNLTLIKLYKERNTYSFVKRQCLHCNEPACVSACLVSALKKNINGIVSYNDSVCIGCRYCMIACPFNIPAFEYESPDPYVRKCDFCSEKLEVGGIPECVRVCPTGAITFGSRRELLEKARDRIRRHPDIYIPHIYGEKEAGGTSVLYLSSVPFEKLGLLSSVGTNAYPEFTKGFLAAVPLVLVIWPMLMMGFKSLNETRPKDSSPEKPR